MIGLSVLATPLSDNQAATPSLAPLVTVKPAASEVQSANAPAPAERLAYSNTLGSTLYTFSDVHVADDLYLTAFDGCSLARLEFMVRGDPVVNLAYSVNFALYDRCPRLGGSIIPGTDGRASVPDGNEYWIVVEPPPEVDIPLPRRLWLALSFSRPDAGWVGGAPALVGFTDNIHMDAFFSCQTPLGSSPYPHDAYAGFNAKVYVREPCETAFYGYRGGIPDYASFTLAAGSLQADDVELSVADCQMIAYEVGVRGFGTMHVDLRLPGAGGFPGEILPGTELDFNAASNAPQLARRVFDPPILAPRFFWVTVSPSSSFTRIMTGRPPVNVGDTAPTYAAFENDAWTLKQLSSGGFPSEPFQISVYCAGDAPIGACCDMYERDESGEAVCREVAEINCYYPPRGSSLLPAWQEAFACSPDPFERPCGLAACCRPDGECEDATRNACLRNATSWNEGIYCDGLPFACEYVCVPNEGSCGAVHSGPGCNDPTCCREVCARPAGDFCCLGFWDQTCVDLARTHCRIPPPNDECAPQGELTGATLVNVPGSRSTNHLHATENESDVGFCCHATTPGAKGFATVWYRFVATGPTAELSTCGTVMSASDSLIQVFSVGDPSTPQSACARLEPIGCADNGPLCATRPLNGRVCLNNLIEDRTYYVMVAIKTTDLRGNYSLEIRESCQAGPPGPCPCSVGEMAWLNPTEGSVDARIPHPVEATVPRFGVTVLTTRAPAGNDRLECWQVCENPPTTETNTVAEVIPGTSGVATAILARPPAPLTATTVAYKGAPAHSRQVTIYSHPGNVNADSVADAFDAAALIPILNGSELAAYDMLSADIDRSGRITPLDLLMEMNLLNGAEEFAIWDGTSKPAPVSLCD